jgi:hypothetical protein
MTRREIHWRLEMAAKRMQLRSKRAKAQSPVDSTDEFTEEEGKALDAELQTGLAAVAARFKKPSR